MSLRKLKPCPKCHTDENWRRSRAQGFIEEKMLPLAGISFLRCTSCGRRTWILGKQRIDTGRSHADASNRGAPVAKIANPNDEDFRQLIADLRDSEKRSEAGGSR